MMNIKSEYKEYEGLVMEEVVQLELEKNGFDKEDLSEDQMERFKEEMRQRMDGACILDGVLTEIPIYSAERLKRMQEKESAEE